MDGRYESKRSEWWLESIGDCDDDRRGIQENERRRGRRKVLEKGRSVRMECVVSKERTAAPRTRTEIKRLINTFVVIKCFVLYGSFRVWWQ